MRRPSSAIHHRRTQTSFFCLGCREGGKRKRLRFTVQQAKDIIEAAGLNQLLGDPSNLPLPQDMNAHHRVWRNSVIRVAGNLGLNFTHGVAAKLINVYLKAAFVCGGNHAHPSVQAVHPPIDSVLLDELSARDIGGNRRVWNEARRIRWSKFDSKQYEAVIESIRSSMANQALWKVEEFWQGYQ